MLPTLTIIQKHLHVDHLHRYHGLKTNLNHLYYLHLTTNVLAIIIRCIIRGDSIKNLQGLFIIPIVQI